MSYRVVITDTAKQDLREIAFAIVERAQEKESARRLIQELRTECRRLEEFPRAGALPKDHILRSFDYRFLVHGDYLIFYSIDEGEKAVFVLAIFHAKRDYFRVMRKFF